jgi:hypothetical protein
MCERGIYTPGVTVKVIVVKLSSSTIKTNFFDKINDAASGDFVEQV